MKFILNNFRNLVRCNLEELHWTFIILFASAVTLAFMYTFYLANLWLGVLGIILLLGILLIVDTRS